MTDSGATPDTPTASGDGEVGSRPWATEKFRDIVGLIARVVLGGVLVYAGGLKIGKPLTSARAVQAYELFPDDLAATIGQALPFIEVVVGLLLILGLFTRVLAGIGTFLMLAFSAGIAWAWAKGLTIDCGCFGGGGQIAAADTKYPQEIVRDLALAACGLWLCVRPRSLASLDRLLFRS